jgi:hypothetical protein
VIPELKLKTKKYLYIDLTALLFSVLILENVPFYFQDEIRISLNHVVIHSVLGVFSFSVFSFYFYEKKRVFKVPTIILIIFGGTFFWFFLKSSETIIRNIVKTFYFESYLYDFNQVIALITLYSLFSLVLIPVTLLVTFMLVGLFRFLVYLLGLIQK